MARLTLGQDREWLFAGRPWQSLFLPQRAPQYPPGLRLPLRHGSSLGGCGRPEAGEVELQLAPQTLDALGLQSHDFIQPGHKIFKILRRNNTTGVFSLDSSLPDHLF